MRGIKESAMWDLYDRTWLDGGATMRLTSGGDTAPVTSGFTVAATDVQHTVEADGTPYEFQDMILTVLGAYDPDVIGTWQDTDGTIYVGPIEVFESEDDARQAAEERKQLAYFDLNAMREVIMPLGEVTAESLGLTEE